MAEAPNRLVEGLRALCASRIPDETWLIAPSRRVGIQWLDAVAMSGQPVVNFRVKTLRGLALQMAAPGMAARGVGFMSKSRSEIVASRALERLSKQDGGYLAGLMVSPGLTRTLSGAFSDLRMAGLVSGDLDPGNFEVAAKGQDVKALLEEYEQELEASYVTDYAGAFLLAIDRLNGESSAIDASTLVVLPDDQASRLRSLERDFWDAIPEANRLVLDTDRPARKDQRPDNVALLSWVDDPAEAPAPDGLDGTVEFFRAIGEVNEVREVLRRCVERGIPFDDVEIIYSDGATYIPLIHELCCRLSPGGAESIPVTFYEGIPSVYARPARALLGWLTWIAEDYSQSVLVDMVSDGLLSVGGDESRGLSFSRLGAMLRTVPIGGDRERYLDALDRELDALRARRRQVSMPTDDDEVETPEARSERLERMDRRIDGIEELRRLVVGVLDITPVSPRPTVEHLGAATAFLDGFARTSGLFDQYCLTKLREDIAEMSECLAGEAAEWFHPLEWLAALPGGVSIEGKGPRPGCLYVSSLKAGGYSGRGHTFLIGLDDGRFPGSGAQDPLLLDGERARLSAGLPTGAGRLGESIEDFARLMARLRGSVTLGYCCRGLADDREMFPSPVVLSAYRILVKRDGDHADLAAWVGNPVSFAPVSEGRCVDHTEWWLSRTCGDVHIDGIDQAIAISFPNVARGAVARAARASDLFTEYDGYVPEAGAECDPAMPDGPVLSASRLETLARCPLEYFFKYVLKVEPPEEYELDPLSWLDNRQRGELLHSAFRRFMSGLAARGLKPEFPRDAEFMRLTVDEEITGWQTKYPPPGALVLERERQEMQATARIFLQEEHHHCKECTPSFFEVSIGVEPEGEGCALDTPEPATVMLGGELAVRVRGRIDRIDLLGSAEGTCYALWDYKTGNSYGYKPSDPFLQGRHIQNALYLELATARLADVDPGATVVSFGYFFPGVKAHGDRVAWRAEELAAGPSLLTWLCRMIALGCFPFTDIKDDVKFSDYKTAFGDVEEAASDTKRKLANQSNEMLRPFRELRDLESREEGS